MMEDMESECPNSFICSITQGLMVDPVTASDGQSYEREAIVEWFKNHDTSPMRGHLPSKNLIPNIALRNSIEEWKQTHFKTVTPSQLTIKLPAIATSSFKTVYQGEYHAHGVNEHVAILEVRSGDFAAEAKTMTRLAKHPRLVRYIGLCTDGDKHQLITEYAQLGSLDAAMETIEDDISPAHQLTMLQQICSGMEALSNEGIVHRDLALRNCLLFEFDKDDVSKVSVKVSDFGLSVSTYGGNHRTVLNGPKPIRYMAPEALEKSRFSEKTDVWAFGVTAWELLTCGKVPYFIDFPEDNILMKHVLKGGRLARPEECMDSCFDQLWSLIEKCWAHKPAQRPTFAQLSVFLGQINMESSTSPSSTFVQSLKTLDAYSTNSDELFLHVVTGEIGTTTQLVKLGYEKSDCESVNMAAGKLRISLKHELAGVENTRDHAQTEIEKVKAVKAQLQVVANTAADSIKAHMALLSEAVKQQEEKLIKTVSLHFQSDQGLLDAQINSLQKEISDRLAFETQSQNALQLDNLKLCEQKHSLLEQLHRANQDIAPITPAVNPFEENIYKPEIQQSIQHIQTQIAAIESGATITNPFAKQQPPPQQEQEQEIRHTEAHSLGAARLRAQQIASMQREEREAEDRRRQERDRQREQEEQRAQRLFQLEQEAEIREREQQEEEIRRSEAAREEAEFRREAEEARRLRDQEAARVAVTRQTRGKKPPREAKLVIANAENQSFNGYYREAGKHQSGKKYVNINNTDKIITRSWRCMWGLFSKAAMVYYHEDTAGPIQPTGWVTVDGCNRSRMVVSMIDEPVRTLPQAPAPTGAKLCITNSGSADFDGHYRENGKFERGVRYTKIGDDTKHIKRSWRGTWNMFDDNAIVFCSSDPEATVPPQKDWTLLDTGSTSLLECSTC
eukprot:m.225230 g.225230  ORF g.225230 m.225230 type:complete len:903 (+) comp33456_c0_seq1:492-3200(+)